jgi:hypothetical protein
MTPDMEQAAALVTSGAIIDAVGGEALPLVAEEALS